MIRWHKYPDVRKSTVKLSRLLALCGWFVLLGVCAQAQSGVWQPSSGQTQMSIWPSDPPDPQPVRASEVVEYSGTSFIVAGKQVIGVDNVTKPTITLYSPSKNNTGVAVVVFPGGGYATLAIDLEGTEACDWLTAHGVTCVLLKYRVTDVGPFPRSGPYPESPMALEDAQRTIGLVRLHAAEWHIDPHKVGVLGFSAGGHLVAAISNHFDKRIYRPIDGADKESCRPDFAVAIYPGHLSRSAAKWDATRYSRKFQLPNPKAGEINDPNLALNPDLHPSKSTPPTFLLQAEDDRVDSVYDSLSYYIALQRAGVPVEMHLYPNGGHAFGLRRTQNAITQWPELLDQWLLTIGMFPH